MTFISTRGQQRGLNRGGQKRKGVTDYLSSKSKKNSTMRLRKRVKGQGEKGVTDSVEKKGEL